MNVKENKQINDLLDIARQKERQRILDALPKMVSTLHFGEYIPLDKIKTLF